jgi:hypothetical protein
MSELHRRRLASPVRLTLACKLGGAIDGAWWPYTASEARELPELIDALRDLVGEVIDIGVNWSPLDGVPDLDSLTRIAAIPGHQAVRHQRVMTVTGSRAQVKLLVIPLRTSRALAVMVLRQAAALPILPMHLGTAACRAAEDIVRAARAECAVRGTVGTNSA